MRARRNQDSDSFANDLPVSSPPGLILLGTVFLAGGLFWLQEQADSSVRTIYPSVMTAFGLAVLGLGMRALVRQLAIGREARRALDEHPELETELRRAKQDGRSPGRTLREKGYENVKLRRAILRRVDLR